MHTLMQKKLNNLDEKQVEYSKDTNQKLMQRNRHFEAL